MDLAAIRARLEAIQAERRAIHTEAGDANFTPEQEARWAELDTETTELENRQAELVEAEERAKRVAESRARWGSTQVKPSANDDFTNPPVERQAIRDAVMRNLEGKVPGGAKGEKHVERLVKRHSGDTDWSRQILARSNPVYADAFAKMVTGRQHLLTGEEQRAMIAVGTATSGGILVPAHLDPTLIITDTGTQNIVRELATVKTLTGGSNIWNGVSTAGVTASWIGEGVEIPDNTPAFASVSIPLGSAKAFIQASYEALDDIQGLNEDVAELLFSAKDELEAAAHISGTGSGQPTGLVTQLAGSAQEVVSATAATIAVGDLQNVYRKVPQNRRRNAAWMANSLYLTAIRNLGTAVSSTFSGDLRDPLQQEIYGRPTYENDDMPSTQTTTSKDAELIFGRFSDYYIVDKPGSASLEYIPNMFDVANNLPNGRRGWVLYFRTGGKIVNLPSFALLVDKTSA